MHVKLSHEKFRLFVTVYIRKITSVNCYEWHCAVFVDFYCLFENIIPVAWCVIPPSLSHGTVYFSPNNTCDNDTCPRNTIASFICDSEYYLVGYGSIWCVGNGEWDLPFPTCEGKPSHQVILSSM